MWSNFPTGTQRNGAADKNVHAHDRHAQGIPYQFVLPDRSSRLHAGVSNSDLHSVSGIQFQREWWVCAFLSGSLPWDWSAPLSVPFLDVGYVAIVMASMHGAMSTLAMIVFNRPLYSLATSKIKSFFTSTNVAIRDISSISMLRSSQWTLVFPQRESLNKAGPADNFPTAFCFAHICFPASSALCWIMYSKSHTHLQILSHTKEWTWH